MAEAEQIAADLEHSEQIAAKDAQIAALQAELNARAEHVKALDDALAAADAQIAALQAAARAAEKPDAVPAPAGTPSEIQLTAPYGFVDDAGRNRSWPAGMKIASFGEVAMLIARGAPHTVTRA